MLNPSCWISLSVFRQVAQDVDELVAVLVHILLIPSKHRLVVKLLELGLGVASIANHRLDVVGDDVLEENGRCP